MSPLSCGYCGRRQPKRAQREHAVGSKGQRIAPGYWQWEPGQAVCCNAKTSMPWGEAVTRVRPRVWARLMNAAEAAGKETAMKKGEITLNGQITREGGRWTATLTVSLEGLGYATVSGTASNPHHAASLAVDDAVRSVRRRQKAARNGGGA